MYISQNSTARFHTLRVSFLAWKGRLLGCVSIEMHPSSKISSFLSVEMTAGILNWYLAGFRSIYMHYTSCLMIKGEVGYWCRIRSCHDILHYHNIPYLTSGPQLNTYCHPPFLKIVPIEKLVKGLLRSGKLDDTYITSASSLPRNVIATPLFPARPVRPIRWV